MVWCQSQQQFTKRYFILKIMKISRLTILKFVLMLCACIFFSSIVSAQNIHLVEVFKHILPIQKPVDLKTIPDAGGNQIVLEQRGKAYIFHPQKPEQGKKLLFNLRRVSQKNNETGLLCITFDPDFVANRFFYLYYTEHTDSGLKSFVERFKMPENFQTMPENPRGEVIFSCNQPYSNHNGGCILFGSDKLLYISLGDGGSAGDPHNHSQNLKSYLGKILRIDVQHAAPGQSYSIPADNAFATMRETALPEIFAYGLRNTWRMSFDTQTNRLWGGDVGQNAWEEVNIIENGKNYGWKHREGFECYAPSKNCEHKGLTPPVHAYPQHNDDKSVTGGYVYRGSTIPKLKGKYVYGDYVSGRIWALDINGEKPNNELIIDTQNPRVHISSFAEDTNGELYVLSHIEGKIYQIQPTAAKAKP
jgi:glucose/arabinose dehydrogenase